MSENLYGEIKIVRHPEGGFGFEVVNFDALTAIGLLDYVKNCIANTNFSQDSKNITKKIDNDDLPPNIRKRFGLN